MTNYQRAKLEIYRLIILEAIKAASSVAQVPEFEAKIERLKEILAEIDRISIEQEKDLSGYTVDKNRLKNELVQILSEIAGALQSYALEKGNNSLYETINFSYNSLNKMRQAKVVDVGTLIHSEAIKLSAEDLARYGISTADLEEMSGLLARLKKDIDVPRHGAIAQSNQTQNLKLLFKEGNLLKKNHLDKLINLFKRRDPDFYMKYMAAKNLIYRPSHRKSQNGENNNTTEAPKTQD